MNPFETIRALGDFPFFRCQMQDIRRAAGAGSLVLFAATVNDKDSYRGGLVFDSGTQTLNGNFLVWQDLGPTDPPSLFHGTYIDAGKIQIKDNNEVLLEWQGTLRTLDAFCFQTNLVGQDSNGDNWFITVDTYALHLASIFRFPDVLA